jgi:ATP-dependent Clp protease adapter protein ClpS
MGMVIDLKQVDSRMVSTPSSDKWQSTPRIILLEDKPTSMLHVTYLLIKYFYKFEHPFYNHPVPNSLFKNIILFKQ